MRRFWCASALAGVMALAAGATGAQELKMAVGSEVTSIDPHYHNISPNNALAAGIFATLVDRDPQGRLQPSLALSWKPISDTVWEFELRPDVVFHNGSKFTAEDVAFTIERIPQVVNSPGSFSTYIYSIERVEIIDPLTVRLHTKAPDPLLPVSMSTVWILDDETHQGLGTADFNSGKGAIGTGPYRFVSYRPGEVIELERNDDYWGEAPDWERVNYRMITNDAARVAALLSGDVDFINQPPTSDIQRLKNEPGLVTSEIDSLRLFYLLFDQTGEAQFVTDMSGKPLTGPENPLLDSRVRRALTLGIDREAIVSRIMEGNAAATGQFMPEGAKGHVPDIGVPEFDPEEAKRLLSVAGYPDGFQLTLHGSNDRYPNDSLIMQAVGQMWARIGVPTKVVVAPYASYITRASRQEYSAFQGSWGSSTGDPLVGLRSVFATYDKERGLGSVNRGRYSNPELDTLLLQAMQELDEEKREAMVHDVIRMAMEDTAIIPLHFQRNIWVMREGISHVARMDEHTRPQDVKRDDATR